MELVLTKNVESNYDPGMCVCFKFYSFHHIGIISNIFIEVNEHNVILIKYEIINENNISNIVEESSIVCAISKEQLDFLGIASDTIIKSNEEENN